MSNLTLTPLHSLKTGTWFKLICGASYQHLPSIRNLALVYTLAGADCIDMAPDPAVIHAVHQGIAAAQGLASTRGARHPERKPWLMVSFNDGEDPHFRKAVLRDAEMCPTNCHRPCEPVCPTAAISSVVANGLDHDLRPADQIAEQISHQVFITPDLCYGCGRCLNVCPSNLITAKEQVYRPEFLWEDLELDSLPKDNGKDNGTDAALTGVSGQKSSQVMIDAIEIHTQPHRVQEFHAFWQRISPIVPTLSLMAVSFPDCDDLEAYLRALLECMEPRPQHLIWQTDGRPMSGDIGAGTTHAALHLARKVLDFQLPMGFVQLAGGTNHTTVAKMRQQGIKAAGIAYGSYGRKILADLLDRHQGNLEDYPEILDQAVKIARSLVEPLKGASPGDF
jgi:Fe-S-cluster-containing hydrogenase component 2